METKAAALVSLLWLCVSYRASEAIPVHQLRVEGVNYPYAVRVWVGSNNATNATSATGVDEGRYFYSCLGMLVTSTKVFTSGYCKPCSEDKKDVYIHAHRATPLEFKDSKGLTYEYCDDKEHPDQGKRVGFLTIAKGSLDQPQYVDFGSFSPGSTCQVLFMGSDGILGVDDVKLAGANGTCTDTLGAKENRTRASSICVKPSILKVKNLDPGSPLICANKVVGIYDMEYGRKMGGDDGDVLPFVRLDRHPFCQCIKKRYGSNLNCSDKRPHELTTDNKKGAGNTIGVSLVGATLALLLASL